MSDLVLCVISLRLRCPLPLIAPLCQKRSTSRTFLLVLLLLMSVRLILISTSVLLMANHFDPTCSSSSWETCLSSCHSLIHFPILFTFVSLWLQYHSCSLQFIPPGSPISFLDYQMSNFLFHALVRYRYMRTRKMVRLVIFNNRQSLSAYCSFLGGSLVAHKDEEIDSISRIVPFDCQC
jgi:hypothetical protein